MAKQQQKRRRKRYQAGSAYAGDVRPTGVLGFLGGATMIKVVFLIMAAGIAVGGLVGVLQLTSRGNSANQQGNDDFVIQGEDDEKPTPTPLDRNGQAQRYTSPPPMTIDRAKTYVATIKTDLGEIEVRLFDDEVPRTVNNFVFLARDGFYDNLVLEAYPDFFAEVGDPPCRKKETGGRCRQEQLGYDLDQEQPGPITVGTLGMINGSGFFIALTESSEFDGFTPFGEVTSGLDVARQLKAGDQIRTIEISET